MHGRALLQDSEPPSKEEIMTRMARSADWKTTPLPECRIEIPLDLFFEEEEAERLQRGLNPEEMEDRWFIYWEGDALYCHRSWTGICMFVVHFERRGAVWLAVKAEVNDAEGHFSKSGAMDAGRWIADLLASLIRADRSDSADSQG